MKILASLNLKERLNEKEREFHGKDDIFGMTLMTRPGYISAGRCIMLVAHLRQFVNLVNPEPPRSFTHYENIAGDNSTGYYASDANYEVIDIIPKFADGKNDKHLYLMFVYDKATDTYDVITKHVVENLTEKFGYVYNNDVLDSKEIGDEIETGEVLYKSTSYDEYMNYCYGRNAVVMYTLDNHTIEDAILARKGFAESTISKEVEHVKVSLNDNDILDNLYGGKDKHKCFPDIGEYVNNKIVCARRRIFNNQKLFDLKKSNLRTFNPATDQGFYMSGKVVDIDIYSNKSIDEIPDTDFNVQIKHYLKLQNEFYQRVYDRCSEIIESGSNYSNDIGWYYSKSEKILAPNCAWKEENGGVFTNLIIDFTIERNNCLSVGSKLTGRQGNKGVISAIVDDDEMPYLENGKKVDLILNALGVINRLNSDQLFEQSINFICNLVADKLQTMKTLKEKEKLLFDIIDRLSKDEVKALKEYYDGLSTAKKKEFFEDINEHGIYIHRPPMWEDEAVFDKIRKIYDDYEWIRPVDVYINKFGRKIKIMNKMVIGELYMMKLKQNSKKNFSARSTGALSRRGLPDKSFKNKAHQDLYSSTPIRLGLQENFNALIGVSPEDVAMLHMYYRSSSYARVDLGKRLMKSIKRINKLHPDEKTRNRNAEILGVYLKSLGVQINFLDDYEEVVAYDGAVRSYETRNGLFIGTMEEHEDAVLRDEIAQWYHDKGCFIGSVEDYEDEIEYEFEKAKMQRDYDAFVFAKVEDKE